jgi:hypothetical protein
MMRRKTILALIIGLSVASVLWAFWNREPTHRGRSLSFWLEQINDAGSLESCEPSLEAIRAMGSKSLPFLLKNIENGEHSWFETKMFALVKRFPKTVALLPVSTRNQSPTCLALKTLGTNASPIVLELGRLAAEPKTTRWAALALFSIGPAGAPGFELACESSELAIRANSARFLCKVTDNEQRSWAWGWNPDANGKRRFGIGTHWGEEDLRALANLLRHTNASVRRASAEAFLLYHTTDGAMALRELKRAVKDDNQLVSQAVTEAVAAIEDHLRKEGKL